MDFNKLENFFEDENIMKSKMVLVWGQDDLLSWAVNFFLTTRKDWDVVSLSSERGIDFLIQEVETLNPDVVIVYQTKCVNSARLLMQLLYTRPELTKVYVQEVSDLISVVDGEYHFVH